MEFKVHIDNVVPLLTSAKPTDISMLVLMIDRFHENFSFTDEVVSMLIKDAIDEFDGNIDEFKENMPNTFKVLEKFGICQ